MTNLTSLNTKLKSFKLAAGFDTLVKDTNTVASSVQALNSTSLGGLLNETLSGVQSLNTTTNSAAGIATLTGNIPGITDQIIKDVSQSKTALDAITGTSNDNGFLNMVITSPTPEGVKASIGSIATLTTNQTENILGNITPKKYADQVKDISIKDFSTFSNDFSSSLGTFISSFNNLTQSQTGNPLQDILLQTNDTPISMIENFGVPRDQAPEILVLLQSKEFEKASIIVSSVTGKSITETEAFLATVPTTLNQQLSTESAYKSNTGVFDVSSKNNTWQGSKTTNEYFDIIATQEQLLVEFIKCPREITEIVFYGHEMTPDQVLSAKDIHASYNADGNDGIPFHYVIQPGGNLQRGRPLAAEGTYSTTHNKYSVGIVIPHYQNSDANIHQGATVRQIFEAFYQVWPGGQAFDAKEDLNESNVSVGISVTNYVESFKKINWGGASRSFSTAQLISAAQGIV